MLEGSELHWSTVGEMAWANFLKSNMGDTKYPSLCLQKDEAACEKVREIGDVR